MTLRLTQSAEDDPDNDAEADLRRRLRGARVYCAGNLASMDHEDLERALTTHTATLTEEMNDCTLAVVGDGNWPLAMPGSKVDRLRVLEELDKRATRGLAVVGERELIAALGIVSADEAGAHGPQLFTTARLTELLGVSRERIRAWVKAGLIAPAREEHGVLQFDFRQVSAARTLCDLAASGVGTDRVRRGVALLKKFMPDLEQPLERLAQIATTDGRLLVRLEDGDLAEPDGQLHFEFGSSGATAPPSSPLRIAPGPHTAADWLTQGLEQEREGFLQEAAASYREALLAGGPDAQACLNLANVLRALGSRPQALERYAQAVETEPTFVDAWNNMGTLLVELGRADDAVVAFRRALDADPEDARAHYNLADTLDDLGRAAEATPHWRAYLRQDATSEWAAYARKRAAR